MLSAAVMIVALRVKNFDVFFIFIVQQSQSLQGPSTVMKRGKKKEKVKKVTNKIIRHQKMRKI